MVKSFGVVACGFLFKYTDLGNVREQDLVELSTLALASALS